MLRQIAQIALSTLIGFVVCWALLRGTKWTEVSATLANVRIEWLLLAQFFAFSSHFARVYRWRFVVRAAGQASFRTLFNATQIGQLVNFMVPARLGELARAYVLSRSAAISFGQSLAVAGVDRVNDVIGLLAVLFVTLLALPTNRSVSFPAGTFGNTEAMSISSAVIGASAATMLLTLCALVAGLVTVYLNQSFFVLLVNNTLGRLSARMARKVNRAFLSLASGLHIFRSFGDMTRSIMYSFVCWGAGVASLGCIFTGFNLHTPWFGPFLAMAMIAVCISMPIAPGMIGQYHFAVIAALMMLIPEVDPNAAKAASLLAHASALVPVGVLGIYSLLNERLSLSNAIRKSAESGLSTS